MKVLHVISSVNPKGGGPIEGVSQLSLQLSRLGHQLEVVTLDSPNAAFISAANFRVHALGYLVFNYRYSAKLVPWLRTNAGKYDAVIINGIWQYHSFAAWRVLSGGNTPYFVFTHGMLAPWFKQTYPLKHLKKWLYWPWADYRVLRDARAVLFTCEEERLLARESFWLYRCNEVVVNYGTAKPSGDTDEQREEFLGKYPELRNKRLFLFLSRIHPVKGCDLLIEAFSRVAGRDGNLHLVMAGPDQVGWQSDLVKLSNKLGIADRITWTGMLTGNMKWGVYHASEAFVLPSHQENFGIVVAEALACGLPVLISNKVNIWREIEQDSAGLVATDTLEGTVDLLNRWLSMSAGEWEQMSIRAHECFLNRFEIQKAAQSLIGVISGFTR